LSARYSQSIADFGRYPIAKGIEPLRRAAANWLSARFDLPRQSILKPSFWC